MYVLSGENLFYHEQSSHLLAANMWNPKLHNHLVCVAKETGLCLTRSKSMRTGFLLATRIIMSLVVRKPVLCHMRKQRCKSASRISAFVFATQIVQSLFFLNTKFQVSRHLVWSCSLVCVGPGRKPRRPVFSQRGSYILAEQESIQPLFDIFPGSLRSFEQTGVTILRFVVY